MRKLYSHPLSGPAHRVRMMLSFLDLKYEEITVDLLAGAQHTPEFRAMNPRGKVPILHDDDGTLIYDSHAILVYLARKHGEEWFPNTPAEMGKIMQWISFSANEIHQSLYMARLNYLLNLNLPNIESIVEQSRQCLDILDIHLSTRSWLEIDRPTIADVACFPPISLSREGQLPLDNYKHVVKWIERVKALPNYVSMIGLS